MDLFTQEIIMEGIRLVNLSTDRFKTTRISLRFAVKMDNKTAAAFAAVPGLLRYTSARYPDNMKMERKLASLYGAGMSASCGKHGDAQILSFTISSVADRFAFNDEHIMEESLCFLLETIFQPDLDENGLMKEDNLSREKRLMKEAVMAEMNDKMSYSFHQFSRLFYEGEGASIPYYGSLDAIEELTVQDVTQAWKTMLQSAQIMIVTIGEFDRAFFEKAFMQRFSTVGRLPKPVPMLPHLSRNAVKRVHETQPLEQCKLNLGFTFSSENSAAGKVFNSIFGGNECSLLSLIVREKMSLCYYCSSVLNVTKQTMIVYSGIAAVNRKQCIEAILEQLETIKRCGVTEEQLAVAKRKLKEYYLGFDTPLDIARFYYSQMFEEECKRAQELIAQIQRVTPEEVIEFARTVRLDTIYSLGENE